MIPRITGPGALIACGVAAAWVVIMLPLTYEYPKLALAMGWPLYDPNTGMEGWAAHALWLGLFALLAHEIAQTNRWLGGIVLMVGLTVAWRGALQDLTTGLLILFAAWAITRLRHVSPAGQARASAWIGLAALGQAIFVLVQALGYNLADVLTTGMHYRPELRMGGALGPRGSIGNQDLAADLIAIGAPLLPVLCWPLAVAGIVVTKSLGGMAALIVGFAMRLPGRLRVSVLVGGVAVMSLLGTYRGFVSGRLRVEIWVAALIDWMQTNPIFGLGLGGWYQRVPKIQAATRLGMDGPVSGFWTTAHNEVWQWIYETGLVGAVLLGGYLWSERRMVLHPRFGPAVASIAVVALVHFPAHIVATGMLTMIVLGLAQAQVQQ